MKMIKNIIKELKTKNNKSEKYMIIEDNTSKYIIKKNKVKLIHTFAEETNYLIQFNYDDTYEVLVFKNKKDCEKEFNRIKEMLEQ